jgi:hypothetical protein
MLFLKGKNFNSKEFAVSKNKNEGSDPKSPVRRVTLPSGRVIEVVYFDNNDQIHDQPARRSDHELQDLTICPVCAGKFVYPVEWEEVPDFLWKVQLRCPDCEFWGDDLFDQETVDRFDEKLDEGTYMLVRDLRRLTRANMKYEFNRFVRALKHDGITAEEFGTWGR